MARRKRVENKGTLNEIMSRPVIRRQPSKVRMTPTPQVTQSTRDEQRIQELRTMPYLEYLRTPEWKAKQQQILERDGHRCRVCDSAEQLNVHHRTPRHMSVDARGQS